MKRAFIIFLAIMFISHPFAYAGQVILRGDESLQELRDLKAGLADEVAALQATGLEWDEKLKVGRPCDSIPQLNRDIAALNESILEKESSLISYDEIITAQTTQYNGLKDSTDKIEKSAKNWGAAAIGTSIAGATLTTTAIISGRKRKKSGGLQDTANKKSQDLEALEQTSKTAKLLLGTAKKDLKNCEDFKNKVADANSTVVIQPLIPGPNGGTTIITLKTMAIGLNCTNRTQDAGTGEIAYIGAHILCANINSLSPDYSSMPNCKKACKPGIYGSGDGSGLFDDNHIVHNTVTVPTVNAMFNGCLQELGVTATVDFN